jgi:hypothetical protein
MMQSKHIVAGLLLVHAGAISAQDHLASRTHHYLGYEPGHIQLKEANLIPKVFSGLAHSLTYGFETAGGTYRSFQFTFVYDNPSTGIEREFDGPEGYTKINGQFHFSYSHDPVHLSSGNLHYYFGPRLSYTYSLSYLHGWDSHAYWGNYLSLGPSNVLRLSIKDNQMWQTALDLSLVGLYSRPDLFRQYKVQDWSFFHILRITNEGYTAGLWNNAFQLRFSTEYRFAIRGSRLLALGYSSYYSRVTGSEGRPLQELIHRLIARIML